jgi:hypothetical protein
MFWGAHNAAISATQVSTPWLVQTGFPNDALFIGLILHPAALAGSVPLTGASYSGGGAVYQSLMRTQKTTDTEGYPWIKSTAF